MVAWNGAGGSTTSTVSTMLTEWSGGFGSTWTATRTARIETGLRRSDVFLTRFAWTVARLEGWGVEGTIATRQNNPGCIRSWGDLPQASGFAVFPDPAAGMEALREQCRRNLLERGLSIAEFFAGGPGYPGFAPGNENDSLRYARHVSTRLTDARIFGTIGVDFRLVSKMGTDGDRLR